MEPLKQKEQTFHFLIDSLEGHTRRYLSRLYTVRVTYFQRIRCRMRMRTVCLPYAYRIRAYKVF